MENGKTIFQSKTLWVSLAAICTGLGMYFSGEHNLQELIVVASGAIFAILRLVTNKPILTK